jgi:serine/threonine protein kinase/tetratricopeptide (TPR) repeat protein
MATPTSPPLIGRYRVDSLIAEGGTAAVYAGRESTSGRKVALKLLRDEGEPTQLHRRAMRMAREAQAMSLITHPNVVKVYEIGTFDGQVFIAMELVEGSDLKAWLAARPRGWEEVVRAFVAAGRGLVAAHQRGIIHRDFKPHNVMISMDGRVLVTDFGLARTEVQAGIDGPLGTPLTRTSVVLGTPRYMAPEQHQSLAVDARTDQFAFCVALYEALYGQLPFRSDARDDLPVDLAYALEVVQGRVRPPPADPAVPPAIGPLLLRGLSTRPEQRHPTLGALLDALEALLPPVAPPPTARRIPRGPLVATAIAAAAAATTVVLLGRPAEPRCPSPPTLPLDDRATAMAVLAAGTIDFAELTSRLTRWEQRWGAARQERCGADDPALAAELTCIEEERTAMETLWRRLRTDPTGAGAAILSASGALCAATSSSAGSGDFDLLFAAEVPQAAVWLRWIAALDRLDPAVARPPPAGARQVATLAAAALVLMSRGRLQDARQHLGLALTAADADADPRSRGQVLDLASRVSLAGGDLSQASLQLKAALTAFEEAAADPRELARLWVSSAQLASLAGDHPTALAQLDRAASLARPQGPALAAHLRARATVLRRAGQSAQAEEALNRAFEAIGASSSAAGQAEEADLYFARGWVRRDLGNYAQAKRDQERARELWAGVLGAEHPRVIDAAFAFGVFQLEAGELPEAARTLEPIVAARSPRLDPRGAGEARLALARAVGGQDPARARALAREARPLLAPDATAQAAVDAWLTRFGP